MVIAEIIILIIIAIGLFLYSDEYSALNHVGGFLTVTGITGILVFLIVFCLSYDKGTEVFLDAVNASPSSITTIAPGPYSQYAVVNRKKYNISTYEYKDAYAIKKDNKIYVLYPDNSEKLYMKRNSDGEYVIHIPQTLTAEYQNYVKLKWGKENTVKLD